MSAVPKLCECGCGGIAPVSAFNDRRYGYAKGQSKRFIVHHSVAKGSQNPFWNPARITPAGYELGDTKYRHIEMAEKALGKRLPPGAIVHHHDGNRSNNINTNLVICENTAYHALLHQRQRAMAACGNPDWRICRICGQYDSPSNMKLYRISRGGKGGEVPTHAKCEAVSALRRYHERKLRMQRTTKQ